MLSLPPTGPRKWQGDFLIRCPTPPPTLSVDVCILRYVYSTIWPTNYDFISKYGLISESFFMFLQVRQLVDILLELFCEWFRRHLSFWQFVIWYLLFKFYEDHVFCQLVLDLYALLDILTKEFRKSSALLPYQMNFWKISTKPACGTIVLEAFLIYVTLLISHSSMLWILYSMTNADVNGVYFIRFFKVLHC